MIKKSHQLIFSEVAKLQGKNWSRAGIFFLRLVPPTYTSAPLFGPLPPPLFNHCGRNDLFHDLSQCKYVCFGHCGLVFYLAGKLTRKPGALICI